MTTWRLLDTGPADGTTNMAIDEALLACFDPAKDRPILRFYTWAPPALSLGRFQDASQVLDRERCAVAGVPVVRRITGGGVIYHADELTYALVCAPRHIPPASSVKDSFRILTSFLLRFYRALGLDPCYAADSTGSGVRLGERTPFCFAGRESYDILVAGRKIGGNAQRRMRNVIFQHGSIPLVNRAGDGAGFLREPPVGAGAKTAALRELRVSLTEQELCGVMATAFRETLAPSLEEAMLRMDEQESAAAIRERLATSPWGETDLS